MKYVIYSESESELHEEALFWSNEYGWAGLEFAEVYTNPNGRLPLCGDWMNLTEAKVKEKSWEKSPCLCGRGECSECGI